MLPRTIQLCFICNAVALCSSLHVFVTVPLSYQLSVRIKLISLSISLYFQHVSHTERTVDKVNDVKEISNS